MDILIPDDVARLVRSFYARVYADEVLSPVFAHVPMEDHLPTMNRFWSSVLLGTGSYHGDPLAVHRHLHQQLRLNECHFIRWLAVFHRTLDDLFQGDRADAAKQAASSIAARFRQELGVGLLGRPFRRGQAIDG